MVPLTEGPVFRFPLYLNVRNSDRYCIRIDALLCKVGGFDFAGKVRRGTMQQPYLENDSLVQVIKIHPEILQQMLSTVLNIIMFEDCRNQWSMSRPLLGLILLNEEYFKQLRDQVNI